MKSLFSPFWLLLAVGGFLCGCSASAGPSLSELQQLAADQRELLIERDAYRMELASTVAQETQDVSDLGIATGPIKFRRPFIGVTVANPR